MKFLTQLLNIFKKQEIDPKVFNDNIAEKTSWVPLKMGGANFKTRKFVQIYSNRVEFKSTIINYVFPLLFILFPLAFFTLDIGSTNSMVDSSAPFYYIIPFMLISIGVFFLIKARKSIVFDKNEGYFWRGKTFLETITANNKNVVKLSDIYAIQLIQEYIRSSSSSSSSSYYSYELNLVLKDASRLNVTDHGNKKAIIDDAKLLGEFLEVPVWNAI